MTPDDYADDIRDAASRDLDSDERIARAITRALTDVRTAMNMIAAALYALETAQKAHSRESSVIYDDIADTLARLTEDAAEVEG